VSPFFRDLWHDLREKRLWPVAAALLLAVVAIPALLLESSSDEPAGPAAQTAAAAGVPPAQAPVVALADETASAPSDLGEFDPKDPFEPRGSAAPKDPDEAAEPGEAPVDEASSPASGDLPLLGDGSEEPLGGLPDSSGQPAPDSGGDGGGEARRRVSYTYVADVRFGRRDGTARRYPNLARLDVLPRSDTPLLIFLGVSPTKKTAVFLVDSLLGQHGDGRCEPSKDECTFLNLTTSEGHDLHYLRTSEGVEYAIRLLDIRRVRTDELNAARARQARRARRSRRARTGSRRRSAGERRFDSSLFGPDEVVE
jgi:hypothetical protein